MPNVSVAPWQLAAIYNPYDHFAFFGGVATGKTYSGSHFCISQIIHHPEMTGFIGANTYDQLSQATLRELFYWLDHYGFEYVVDRLPPKEWKHKRTLKDYKNTIHVRNLVTDRITLIFIRVLSDGNPLRGIEFSWYWLDETRDTPQDTHDVVISRMRETDNYVRGIITTTTNGEDWAYKRFVLGGSTGGNAGMLYGSMHVPTRASLDLGIITQKYYDTMAKSYSPLMALQELEAQHVNVMGGKAYYAASDRNRRRVAPWGDAFPTRERPLVIGCDFNFNPAPCVWMVGQVGPPIWSADGKEFFGNMIHWFNEISDNGVGTPTMCMKLMSQFPQFFYQVFGDVSGGVGTTSNAGETDYNQMAATFSEYQAVYSIDYWQNETQANPKVKNRVENMNAMFCNALGEIRQTYDPVACPYFDGDVKMVGWKETTTQSGRGKLHDGGDCTRTHATDGAGYAVWKLFPPNQFGQIVDSLPSSVRSEYGLVDQS